MLLMIAASITAQDTDSEDSGPQDNEKENALSSTVNKNQPSKLEPCFPLCFPDLGKRDTLAGEWAEEENAKASETQKRVQFKQEKDFIPQLSSRAFKRRQAVEAEHVAGERQWEHDIK